MKPMKILVFEPCPRDFGGFFRANYIAMSLAKLGHSVTVLHPSKRFCLWPRRTQSADGVQFMELPNLAGGYLSKFFRIPFTLGWALFSKADVLHIFATVHPEILAVALLCRLIGRKFLVDWDDLWTDTPSYETGSWLVRKYLQWAEQTGPRFASGVTLVSHFLNDMAQRLGCRQIHLLPNGVWKAQFDLHSKSAARKSLGIPNEAPVVLAFGNSYLQGRGRLLLECIDEVLRLSPDAVALFNLDPLKVWIEDQGGDHAPETLKRVRCVGRIPQKELGRYLAACDFVVFLSTDRPVEQACYPIRVGSYLNAERPIATNRVNTEVSKLVQTFGCGVVGDSPQHIAQLVVQAFRQPDQMAAMTESAGQAKAALDYEVLATGLADFYKRCLSLPD